jgi:acetyl esterase/lipase
MKIAPAVLFAIVAFAQPPIVEHFPGQGKKPYPLILLLREPGSGASKESAYLARGFASAGYAVLAYTIKGPAGLPGVYAALAYVRGNAKQWNANPHKTILIGHGEAGRLAMLAGMWVNGPRREDLVQGVASLAAYSDHRESASDTLRASVSPVTHLRRDAPPFLLIHGDQDEVVPMVQSTHMQTALRAAGVPCMLILIQSGGHSIQSWTALANRRSWEREVVRWMDGLR